MKADLYFIILVMALFRCSGHSSPSETAAKTQVLTNGGLSCYDSAQSICTFFKLQIQDTPNCDGIGEQVSACPTANCAYVCDFTDSFGDEIRTTYYGNTAVNCASGGTPSPCP